MAERLEKHVPTDRLMYRSLRLYGQNFKAVSWKEALTGGIAAVVRKMRSVESTQLEHHQIGLPRHSINSKLAGDDTQFLDKIYLPVCPIFKCERFSVLVLLDRAEGRWAG